MSLHPTPAGPQPSNFEVIIVGGSYAGLSAALALGRSLRRVLVIDRGAPCNRQTPHSHNFLTRDGETPAAIAAEAKRQVLAYPTVQWREGRAVAGEKSEAGFLVRTEAGETFGAEKLLFATGVQDQMPELDGFAACWGISVLHCPYCHGYEVHGQPLGVLANGEAAIEFCRLIHHWSGELTLFTNGPATLPASHRQELTQRGIRIVEQPIRALDHGQGQLRQVVFENGEVYALTALFARVSFRQHCPLPEALGCQLTDAGHIRVDEMQQTTVAGVFAAGDNTTGFRAVSIATAAGSKAGAMINHHLIQEKSQEFTQAQGAGPR